MCEDRVEFCGGGEVFEFLREQGMDGGEEQDEKLDGGSYQLETEQERLWTRQNKCRNYYRPC